ncbi:hypothetical protein GH808_12365 [Acetobacterium fimetarium]|uniref:Transposase IS200-like domain-containing protein n=1 Tax=Acetobacterium fimetarium TaxID=52691 RepID=A0ABR6WXP3_9FIRM|nr:hypothetical protein [Acetobacterium fimetarium]MBC3805213.1 hypothetical protein [Acetobacterium fimetarium]
MDNHVHLLLKEGEELGTSIKRITVGNVQLHNIKYGRTDHLFQNRFNSEAVEAEQYLMTVELAIEAIPMTGKTSPRHMTGKTSPRHMERA